MFFFSIFRLRLGNFFSNKFYEFIFGFENQKSFLAQTMALASEDLQNVVQQIVERPESPTLLDVLQ